MSLVVFFDHGLEFVVLFELVVIAMFVFVIVIDFR